MPFTTFTGRLWVSQHGFADLAHGLSAQSNRLHRAQWLVGIGRKRAQTNTRRFHRPRATHIPQTHCAETATLARGCCQTLGGVHTTASRRWRHRVVVCRPRRLHHRFGGAMRRCSFHVLAVRCVRLAARVRSVSWRAQGVYRPLDYQAQAHI